VTRLPSETNGAGLLRDTFGRRELTVRNLNDPLDIGDVPGVGTVFDGDGREQVVITGRGGTVLVVANGLTIRGSGRRISVLDQIAGTAAPLLAPASVASSSVGLVIEDLGLTAFNNQAANTGGVVLQATAKSDLRRCRISWTRDFHVKIIGGQSAQGDTMYNTLERNVLENPATTTHYAVWIAPGPDVPAAAKGSHPDGTRILNNHVQSAVNTTGHVGVKVDAPVHRRSTWRATAALRHLRPDVASATSSSDGMIWQGVQAGIPALEGPRQPLPARTTGTFENVVVKDNVGPGVSGCTTRPMSRSRTALRRRADAEDSDPRRPRFLHLHRQRLRHDPLE
jgi:hypothetical protein